MMMNTEVTFIRHITDPEYNPRTHHWEDGEEREMLSVNVTSMSYKSALRDYGISGAKLQTMRSLTPMPYFDEVDIFGQRYVELSRQRIGTKESIVVKEKDA